MASISIEKYYDRFSASERLEHMVLLVSFTMLGVTGLPQRYADMQLAQDFIALMGGIESVRYMHRFFAIMLMMVSIYHGGTVSYKLFVRRVDLSMIPSIRDLFDAVNVFLYNIGLRKHHPKMPRFNFGEKAEYLAVVWGTILMVITGFMMWNPVATAEFLPGAWIPAARYAHSAEAFLAIAAIIIWHMYNVHIKRFNRSMFTGKISHEEMEEEHGALLEDIEAGRLPPEPSPEVIQKRQRVFYPYAAVMTVILVTGLYFFVTFEDTAIETVPRQPVFNVENVDASVGDATLGAELWTSLPCASCHGANGEGVYPVPTLLNTELEIEAFALAIRTGPADMPAFTTTQISDEGIAHLYAYLREQ